MDNLELLSDAQLRLRLLEYGFPNLPVTDTTRKILIKKLRNCMSKEKGKLRSDTARVTSFSSEEESDTDSPRRGRKSSRSPVSSTHVHKDGGYVGIYSRPSTRRTTGYSNIHVSPLIVSDSDDDPDSFNGFVKPSEDTVAAIRNRYTTAGVSGETNGYDTDMRKRLMQIRTETLNHNRNNLNGPLRSSVAGTLSSPYTSSIRTTSSIENDIVCHAEPTPEPAVTPLNVAISNLVNKLDEYYGVKQTFVPCILLSILICFFLIIGGMYLTISPDIKSTLIPESTRYTICDSNNINHIATHNCIEQDQLEPTLAFIRTIIIELQDRAELYKCHDSSHTYIMTVRDLITYLLEVDKNSHVLSIIKTLYNAQYLIEQNPQWRINNVDNSGSPMLMDSVVQQRAAETCCLAILEPVLPLTCTFRNKMQKFFLIVGALALISVSLYMIRALYLYMKVVQQNKRDQVNALIGEITSALVQKAMKARQDPNEDPCIVVTHMRDKLIAANRRKELEWAWNEAIKFLNNNESRISFEVGNRNGEECRLMRWKDATSVNPQTSLSTSINQDTSMNRSNPISTVKTWQGPAFDKTNKIKDPPTPCLKIRQMFDKYDTNDPNLHQVIQDAILAKVGSSCRIYDVQLDKGTLCTYVRCASEEDAGIVHDEINGWWFDNRLVSIKFLRLERYLSRFPNSNQGPTCLRPMSFVSITPNPNNSQNGTADDDESND